MSSVLDYIAIVGNCTVKDKSIEDVALYKNSGSYHLQSHHKIANITLTSVDCGLLSQKLERSLVRRGSHLYSLNATGTIKFKR